jgi:hypothetical protein
MLARWKRKDFTRILSMLCPMTLLHQNLSTSESVIDNAQGWLLNSGIQNFGPLNEQHGGFYAWYEGNTGYSFLYTEATGYGIITLLFLSNLRNNPALIGRATLAADWIRAYALHESGGVKGRYYSSPELQTDIFSFKNETLCSFDTGIVLSSFINLFKVTGQPEYLKIAKEVALFLKKMEREDNLLWPIYNFKEDNQIDISTAWSHQSGSYQAKATIGLINLSELTGDIIYKQLASSICVRALDFQQPSGRFVSSRDQGWTHLHPHCYTIEGLLYAGLSLKDDRFIHAAILAIEWSLDCQCENGGIPTFFHCNGTFKAYQRSDVLAQVLRLGCLALNLNLLNESYRDKLERLFVRLIQFQSRSANPAQKGGFIFGHNEDGQWLGHVNSWCTMFALQAVVLYQRTVLKNASANMEFFV